MKIFDFQILRFRVVIEVLSFMMGNLELYVSCTHSSDKDAGFTRNGRLVQVGTCCLKGLLRKNERGYKLKANHFSS